MIDIVPGFDPDNLVGANAGALQKPPNSCGASFNQGVCARLGATGVTGTDYQNLAVLTHPGRRSL
jgi:hypothetical protein